MSGLNTNNSRRAMQPIPQRCARGEPEEKKKNKKGKNKKKRRKKKNKMCSSRNTTL